MKFASIIGSLFGGSNHRHLEAAQQEYRRRTEEMIRQEKADLIARGYCNYIYRAPSLGILVNLRSPGRGLDWTTLVGNIDPAFNVADVYWKEVRPAVIEDVDFVEIDRPLAPNP